jgi:hypothetical protein
LSGAYTGEDLEVAKSRILEIVQMDVKITAQAKEKISTVILKNFILVKTKLILGD